MKVMPGERAAAVLTVSDGVSDGTREDESGEVAEQLLRTAGFDPVDRSLVPDDRDRIESTLRVLASSHRLVVTTGGTGFGPRDVTPEATRAVLDREAPGLAELMRATGLTATPMAALSRAVAGSLGSTLILNLPGSPRGVRESLEAVVSVVPHAVELLAGATGPHPTGHRSGSPSDGPDGIRDWVEVKAVKVVAGDPPCRVGMSMAIEPDGPVHGTLGCAEFDEQATSAAADVWGTGAPATRVLHHDLGDIEVYLEPHRRPPRLVVVSATDVARALGGHLRRLGYEVVLVESRNERVMPTDGPHVTSIDELELTDQDVVVLTDHDAPDASQVLAAAARSQARFVGMMSSRRHVERHLDAIRSLGLTDDEVGRVHAPVGLDIGGRSAEEIALSIAAGIVADDHGRDGGWLDR
jgi:molybdopterin adenylyltransferase